MGPKLRKAVLVAAAASSLVALATPTLPSSAGEAAQFSTPVKVTPPLGYGYEPTVVADRFGNLFSTAHKENWQLVIAPDPDSPTYTRSMSWDWISTDHGRTWVDIPGLSPASLEQHQFGDEGDMAVDDADHLYFVDTSLVDNSITRWTIRGHGDVSIDYTRPLVPTALLDDRPWVVAHANGHVFVLGNSGSQLLGGGRYTVYQSYDGGVTFDVLGTTLPDSGWCRPAVDHRPGAPWVYVACTNDDGVLYSYVSRDDGRTFDRFRMGTYNDQDFTQSWPTVEVAPDGSLWALYVDGVDVQNDGIPARNRLRLFHSSTHGRTWKEQDITPMPGRYEYAWLSVRNDGRRLGVGVYYRPSSTAAWRVYAAIWRPGQIPDLVSLDPKHPVAPKNRDEAPGDYMMTDFGPDDSLSVVWTRIVRALGSVATLTRDIYYSRSL